MSHLNLETLARLIDDPPDPTEAGHLDICEACRMELEALRADASALRALPDPQPPHAAWLALEQRLEGEGLLHRMRWGMQIMKMAAVLVIFVLGSLAGGLYVRQQNIRIADAAPTFTNSPEIVAHQPIIDETPSMQNDKEPSSIGVSITANAARVTAAPMASAPASTAEEAVLRLREAERAYLTALGRYGELNGNIAVPDPVARLAALESIVATTRAALGQAPADPVINGYHLTAVAQRDATLRQLAASNQTWY